MKLKFAQSSSVRGSGIAARRLWLILLTGIAPWLLRAATMFSIVCGPAYAQDDGESELNSCASCHRPIQQQHAGGVHANTKADCAYCHGGDAFSFDEDLAHDLSLGFEAAPLKSCSECHQLEAELLALGPHGASAKEDEMKGCVDCHGAHDVDHPSHGLLTSACSACHQPGSNAATSGATLSEGFVKLELRFRQMYLDLDYHETDYGYVYDWLVRGDQLQTDFKQLIPEQHTMNQEAISSRITQIEAGIGEIEQNMTMHARSIDQRATWIAPVWAVAGIIAGALVMLIRQKKTDPAL